MGSTDVSTTTLLRQNISVIRSLLSKFPIYFMKRFEQGEYCNLRYTDAAIFARPDGSGSEAKTEYTMPAIAAPMIGATQNSHNCSSAHPTTNTAGPVLRAGFTDRFVTGISMR